MPQATAVVEAVPVPEVMTISKIFHQRPGPCLQARLLGMNMPAGVLAL
jgi:hypothetical protein